MNSTHPSIYQIMHRKRCRSKNDTLNYRLTMMCPKTLQLYMIQTMHVNQSKRHVNQSMVLLNQRPTPPTPRLPSPAGSHKRSAWSTSVKSFTRWSRHRFRPAPSVISRVVKSELNLYVQNITKMGIKQAHPSMSKSRIRVPMSIKGIDHK